MTTNRLHTVVGLIALTALVMAAVLAASLAIDTLHLPPIGGGLYGQVQSQPSALSAEQARVAFRRGEWFASEENIFAPLDAHDRHPSAPAALPVEFEIQRYRWYHGQSAVASWPAGRHAE